MEITCKPSHLVERLHPVLTRHKSRASHIEDVVLVDFPFGKHKKHWEMGKIYNIYIYIIINMYILYIYIILCIMLYVFSSIYRIQQVLDGGKPIPKN